MDGDVILATACRCCLMEDTDMVYVFDILDEFDMKISELITRNGAIVIQERDAFSKHICGNCLNDLAIAERFVLRCRKTNDLLMNLITSDAQEDTERLIVEDEILANMNHENVSYVLAPPGTEASLHQETPFVEEQTIDSLEQFDDEHTIAQAVDSQQLEDDSLFQLQQQQVEEEELKEETVQYQLDYESDTFNGIDSIIPDDAMALSDGLYAEILEDNSLNQEDEELNRIMEDANKDNGVEEQERASVAGMKMFDFKYSCDRCGASFVTLKHYARHLQSHNILACEKCLEILKSVEKLKSHEQLCTRDSKNSVEGDTSEQKSLLTIIAPGSTQQKKSLVCSYCNKRWVSQSALTIHLRTHTGERPFGCRICEKRFKTVSALDLHERRHSGTKPFSCSMCDKRFTEGSNLKVHMLKHTNEKSHVCTVCNRAFARVFLLQLHMRTHTGEKPYECEICGRKFAQQCDLTAHRRIHSGERPYACDVCGKSFTKSSALAQHRKRHQNSF